MPHHPSSEPDVFGRVERDEFVYYLTIAYMLTDPGDWPALRRAIYGGLVAAFGLHPPPTGPYPDTRAHPDLAARRHVRQLLDLVRDQHDPADNWPEFLDELWNHRHQLTEPAPHKPQPPP